MEPYLVGRQSSNLACELVIHADDARGAGDRTTSAAAGLATGVRAGRLAETGPRVRLERVDDGWEPLRGTVTLDEEQLVAASSRRLPGDALAVHA